jgi:hypothetical protein
MKARGIRCSRLPVLCTWYDRVGFDFYQPIGVYETHNLHNRVYRANASKKLAVNCGYLLPIFYPGKQNSGPNHIRKLCAEAFNGGLNDFKTPARLGRRIAFRNGLPSGPSGAVPETAITVPIRTAREIPILGSNGEPVETCCRIGTLIKSSLRIPIDHSALV